MKPSESEKPLPEIVYLDEMAGGAGPFIPIFVAVLVVIVVLTFFQG